jgi:hypothetical protein
MEQGYSEQNAPLVGIVGGSTAAFSAGPGQPRSVSPTSSGSHYSTELNPLMSNLSGPLEPLGTLGNSSPGPSGTGDPFASPPSSPPPAFVLPNTFVGTGYGEYKNRAYGDDDHSSSGHTTHSQSHSHSHHSHMSRHNTSASLRAARGRETPSVRSQVNRRSSQSARVENASLRRPSSGPTSSTRWPDSPTYGSGSGSGTGSGDADPPAPGGRDSKARRSALTLVGDPARTDEQTRVEGETGTGTILGGPLTEIPPSYHSIQISGNAI